MREALRRHRPALITVALACLLDVCGGLVFAWAEHLSVPTGLYWAVTTATTVGYGDVAARTPAGHLITVLVALTVVPLFGATFSLFTAGVSAKDHERTLRELAAAEKRIKARGRAGDQDPGTPPAEPAEGRD